jgi:WD40 repeat protein
VERSLYLLGAMTEQGLRAAIEAPARQEGLLIEPGLVDLLVSEVAGTAGALPLLSHALLETWQRREANTLTVDGYTASGGIRGAVAQSAEAVYAGIDAEQRVVLRDLVLRLVSSGTQGEPVRAKLPRRLFSAEPEHQQLIDLLVGSRLVTSDAGVVEVAHEALARAWPRLRTWLDEDMEGQRIRQHLTSAADAWDSLGRPDSELYRGVRLTQALQWRDRADTRLTAVEVAFLDAGDRNEQSERRAEQVRAKAQARLIRRQRTALAVAVVLLVVAGGAGLTALQQRNRAEENAAAATSAETRSEARRAGASALATDDFDDAMLLAVAAVRLADSPETRSNLSTVLGRFPELIATFHMSGSEVIAFDVSPDESTVASYDSTNHLTLYDLTTGAVLAEYQAGSTDPLAWVWRSVKFSPDGQILAVTPVAPTRDPVQLLDARTLEPLPTQPSGTLGWRWRANTVTFSRDGRRLAAIMERIQGHGNNTHPAVPWGFVWEVDAPARPVASLQLENSNGVGIALDAHGRTLFTAEPLIRHDLASGRAVHLPEPWVDEQGVEILEMSPDGRALAASGQGGVAILDPRSGAFRRLMRVEPDDDGFQVGFSRDGRRVAVIDYAASTALVWDVASGQLVARIPLKDAGEFARLSSTGDTLYTTASGGVLREWDVDGDRRFVAQVAFVPKKLSDVTQFVRPSPDGRFIAYPGGRHVAFFDVTTGEVAATILRAGGYRRNTNAQWHPDGVHFATVSDGEIQVWDAQTGRLVVHARPAGRLVSALDYSTDGSRLVVGELSGQVTMLDSADLTPVGRPVKVDGAVRSIGLGPDNRTAVAMVGVEDTSEFWIGSSQQWAKLDLEAGDVASVHDLGFESGLVEVSPDGTHVAFGGRNGEVMVLDLTTDEPVRPPVTAHGLVVDLTYSDDGARLLTSGFDYKNALWDGRTGELLARVVTNQIGTEAAFTDDRDTVLIAPLWAGAVYEWDTRPEHAIEFACRVAGHSFTKEEWAEQFGDRPYEEICPDPAGS